LSGIQPTGVFTIGNLLGAVSNWAVLQEPADRRCFFMIADLHAMTVPFDPRLLPLRSRVTAAMMQACGVNPARSAIFRQSAIREHAELQWILATVTPLGWLQRMTQFKDKSAAVKAAAKQSKADVPMLKRTADACLGLLAYPVLQAADVLLYQAHAVPVGEDQRQHLELTRDIATSFNALFCKEGPFAFPLPDILSPPGHQARIMSLRDGTKKMSKSDPSSMSRIDITDSPDTLAKKIRKAKTDTLPGLSYDWQLRPERSNLLEIFSVVSREPVDSIVERYEGKSTVEFKEALTEAVAEFLRPTQQHMRELLEVEDLERLATGLATNDLVSLEPMMRHGTSDPVSVSLAEGERQAREMAQSTMARVRELTGLA
jgi:tryptophanyl-tRNA synthetase